MKYLPLLLTALVLALVLMGSLEAAPYACGPNGCGPAYGRASAPRAAVRSRARGPLRALFERIRSRRGR